MPATTRNRNVRDSSLVDDVKEKRKEKISFSRSNDAANEFPYGQSIAFPIWDFDGTPEALKILFVLMTALLICLLPLFPLWMSGMTQINDLEWKSWTIPGLLEEVLKIPESTTTTMAGVTLAVFSSLFVLDTLSEFIPSISWPKFLQTENDICYEEMFCEPKRDSLIRRAGNTYSNFIYLFNCFCVLRSSAFNSEGYEFWVPDATFGSVLGLLSIFSFMWHASNSPIIHYIDLWAMNSSISYLIIRAGAMALPFRSRSAVCFLIFGAFLVFHGLEKYKSCQSQKLHHGCPFSGRARLLNRKTNGDYLKVYVACAFAVTPVLYMILPYLSQYWIIGSSGPASSSFLCALTLAIGWSWRLFERFALDGLAPMVTLHEKIAKHNAKKRAAGIDSLLWRLKSALYMIAGAFLSPTAIHHFFTGLTLLFGYISVRAIDAEN